MKLIDAMRNVDRSEKNHTCTDPEELNQALEANLYYVDWTSFNEEVNEYWLLKWNCTDTHVGDTVGFIGDDPVYLRRQTARKGGHVYKFVSLEAAARIKDMLIKHSSDRTEPCLLDLEEEIADTYTVRWGNSLLSRHGTYKGQSATHVHHGWYKETEKDIFVVIDETQEKVNIPCSDFLIPIHLSLKEDSVANDQHRPGSGCSVDQHVDSPPPEHRPD